MIVASLLLILLSVGLLVAGVLSGSNLLIICTIGVVVLAAIVLIIGVRTNAGTSRPADDETGQFPLVSARGRRPGRRGSDEDRGRPVRGGAATSASATAMATRGAKSTKRRPAGVTGAGAPSAVGGPTVALPIAAPVLEEAAERDPAETANPADMPARPVGGRGAARVPAQGAPSRSVPIMAAEGKVNRADAPSVPPAVPVVMEETQYDEDPPDEPSAQLTPAADVARIATLKTEVIVVDGRPRYHLRDCVHLHARRSEPLPVSEAIELGFTPCGLCEPDSALVAEVSPVS